MVFLLFGFLIGWLIIQETIHKIFNQIVDDLVYIVALENVTIINPDAFRKVPFQILANDGIHTFQ